MRKRLVVLIIMLCFPLNSVMAQEDGWPIEERCAAQSETSPTQWKYDGTILMSGWAGLHGISSKHDTPYIVRFGLFDGRVNPIFSPNGLWVAQERVYITCHQCMRLEYVPYEIIVTSLTEPLIKYTIPIEEKWKDVLYDFRDIPFLWYDNEHVIFFNTVINPFLGTITHPDYLTLPSGWFSPDKTRNVSKPARYSLGGTLLTSLNGEHLFKRYRDFSEFSNVFWLPDSSHFIAKTGAARSSANQIYWDSQLFLFDRDGNLIDLIFETTAKNQFAQPSSWHSLTINGRYFLFHGYRINRQTPVLYVADLIEKRIYDTCFEYPIESGFVSPKVHQFAFVEVDDNSVKIFDLDTWAIYPVGYHQGNILFWRTE